MFTALANAKRRTEKETGAERCPEYKIVSEIVFLLLLLLFFCLFCFCLFFFSGLYKQSQKSMQKTQFPAENRACKQGRVHTHPDTFENVNFSSF